MNIIRRRLTCLVMLGLSGAAISGDVAAASLAAAEFAETMLQKHADLLTPAGQVALDEINRELRIAQTYLHELDASTREEGAQMQAHVSSRLGEFLERNGAVHRVVLQNDVIRGSISGPFEFRSDEGAILMRVENGDGDVRFFTYELDQAKQEHAGAIQMTHLRPGVSWILLGFYNLPVGRTSYPVEIGMEGEEVVRGLITVVTPRSGRVKITVLDDDDGAPTPVMMRITSKSTGRDRPPSNAIGFSGQFDRNGNPTGHREAYLFGRLGGEWWLVPGPFEMELAPGDYEIALRRGAEHLPIFDQVTVTEGNRTDRIYRPSRWVDMRKLGWYSGDDHIHARIMSDTDASNMMTWVRAEDVHVANILKMGDGYRTYFEQRGWGKDYRIVDRDYVLSPGQEDPRTFEIGHALSINTKNYVRDVDKYYLYDWVADAVHAQGGLFGYAHVAGGWFHVDRGMSLNVPNGRVDFAEVLQYTSIGTQLWYDFLNTGFKVTATAGSDVPWGGTVGEVRTYAFLGDQSFSADAWFGAVRRGRTFVTNGPMIEFRVDDALPGDEIHVNDPNRVLRVRARAWGHPDRNLPLKLTILKHGEILRETIATEVSAQELSLDFTITAGDGFWIAARVDANDGSSAHTTPVYVTRGGLRFWKYAQVQQLLDRWLHSLLEIDQIVSTAVQAQDKGRSQAVPPFQQMSEDERRWNALRDPDELQRLETEFDHSLVLLGQQGPELRKQVQEARKIYERLRYVARRERWLRSVQ